MKGVRRKARHFGPTLRPDTSGEGAGLQQPD